MTEYRPVPPQVDLPALEHEVLAYWSEHQTFATSLAQSQGDPRWTFYEGPPTANGRPGTHHVEARVFKDVFPRFKTMQGYLVERKAGWDCHGLPGGAGRREGARLLRQGRHRGLRRRAVQRPLPRVRATARGRLRGDDRADGLLGRHQRPLPHDGPRLRRVGVVGAQADPQQGPAGRGLPRRALLPAVRHRAVRPRARAGLRDGHRPQRLRALPAHLGPVRRLARLRRRCWCGRRPRGRWCRTPPSPSSRTSTTSSRATAPRRSSWPSPLFEQVLGEGWTVQGTVAGRELEGLDLPAPLRAGRVPAQRGHPALRRARRLRHHRGRHRPRAPVPRLR